jgi:hypothetical protein
MGSATLWLMLGTTRERTRLIGYRSIQRTDQVHRNCSNAVSGFLENGRRAVARRAWTANTTRDRWPLRPFPTKALHWGGGTEGGSEVNSLIEQNIAVFLPLFIASVWLTVTTILAVLSGWFRLMAEFPNQAMEPILRVRGQSGAMGLGVSMSGVLTLGVCPSGLRVGIMRVFGPFCRDFFVPWENISVTRKAIIFWPVAKLQFGSPAIGSLTIPVHLANRLARAAMGRWPETGPFPEEKHRDTLRRLLTQWALSTCAAALFFTLVPLTVAPTGGGPPIVVAILFPVIVFGVITIVRFFRERN